MSSQSVIGSPITSAVEVEIEVVNHLRMSFNENSGLLSIDTKDENSNIENITNRKNFLVILQTTADRFIASIIAHIYRFKNSAKSKIITNGSYKLGSWTDDSDLDVVVLFPPWIETHQFFDNFDLYLGKIHGVTYIKKIKDAYVPLIKVVFNDMKVDISFAKYFSDEIPQNFVNLTNDQISRLDHTSQLSINSLRNNEFILNYVPVLSNFQMLAKFIRFWAKQRYMFGNMYGFLGGINIAILAAFICKRYPDSQFNELLYRFFEEYSKWDWSKPIKLNDETYDFADDQIQILTPCYPTINSSRAATASTKALIIKEFQRAESMTRSILIKDIPWEVLCQPRNFFSDYKFFIATDIKCSDSKILDDVSGYINSKLVRFTKLLEIIPGVATAVIYPQIISKNEKKISYIGINTDKSVSSKIDVSPAKDQFLKHVLPNIHSGLVNISIRLIKRSHIELEDIPHESSTNRHLNMKKLHFI